MNAGSVCQHSNSEIVMAAEEVNTDQCADCNHCVKTKYCFLPKGHLGQCVVYACAETDDPPLEESPPEQHHVAP